MELIEWIGRLWAAAQPGLSALRELSCGSVLLRLSLSMLFGGLIGLERERKRRPAGFRTYMLVCMGAALAMLLGEYEALLAASWTAAGRGAMSADVCRIGAQVINGIGFLGAGTVIVTGRQEVKGLTTAAGLWASGCMGLAIGAGFYECVLPGFLWILLCVRFFPTIESAITARSRHMSIYVELRSIAGLGLLLQRIRDMELRIFDVDLDRAGAASLGRPNAVIVMCLPRRQKHTMVLSALACAEALWVIEEL